MSTCVTTTHPDCLPGNCQWRCAVDVIDELLSDPEKASGEQVDWLLDLRFHLRQGTDAEGTLRLFCDLRRTMEQKHYLAFFRIRRWLENHVFAVVQPCQAAEPHYVPVSLNHYCVEAVRRVCLCTALAEGIVLFAPRLQFTFRSVAKPLETLATPEALATLG